MLLRDAYRAFNAGDFDAVQELLCEDVSWPRTLSGGRRRGSDAARAHWDRLSDQLSFRFDPVRMVEDEAGERVLVEAQQTIGDADGKALSHQRVAHVVTFRNERIRRIDTYRPEEVPDPWSPARAALRRRGPGKWVRDVRRPRGGDR